MANTEVDMVTCKASEKEVHIKSLLKHVGRSKSCKIKYGDEYNTLKENARKKIYTKYDKKMLRGSTPKKGPVTGRRLRRRWHY